MSTSAKGTLNKGYQVDSGRETKKRWRYVKGKIGIFESGICSKERLRMIPVAN